MHLQFMMTHGSIVGLFSKLTPGHLHGMPSGTEFYSRAEMEAVGFHSKQMNGIDYCTAKNSRYAACSCSCYCCCSLSSSCSSCSCSCSLLFLVLLFFPLPLPPTPPAPLQQLHNGTHPPPRTGTWTKTGTAWHTA